MRNTNVGIEFELLEVNVPIVVLGTVGVSRPRDGHYLESMIDTSGNHSCISSLS
jgi:hypothetical protein